MKQSLEAKRKPRELQKRLRTLSEAFLAYTAIYSQRMNKRLSGNSRASQRQQHRRWETKAERASSRLLFFRSFLGKELRHRKNHFYPLKHTPFIPHSIPLSRFYRMIHNTTKPRKIAVYCRFLA